MSRMNVAESVRDVCGTEGRYIHRKPELEPAAAWHVLDACVPVGTGDRHIGA
ncbi:MULTISPECIES: hypothetical protein [Paenibacillus]|uniref:hypothetical protein n=1 Tax=Paenibacillus TaxID=44249 RepID=UPI0022B89A23|nr:hypothetical protein [Paenibacillus caseinilyticus]MCZ8521770.1 hypothetical protein [Paenibacillus caseinilyticus]